MEEFKIWPDRVDRKALCLTATRQSTMTRRTIPANRASFHEASSDSLCVVTYLIPVPYQPAETLEMQRPEIRLAFQLLRPFDGFRRSIACRWTGAEDRGDGAEKPSFRRLEAVRTTSTRENSNMSEQAVEYNENLVGGSVTNEAATFVPAATDRTLDRKTSGLRVQQGTGKRGAMMKRMMATLCWASVIAVLVVGCATRRSAYADHWAHCSCGPACACPKDRRCNG
ncbi:MAG: hypothetical protein ACRERU_03910 [Methylococcales bacterium]